MPIDPMILDAILVTFRNMAEDCRQKNISGEDFDNMCVCLARLEELGQQHSDMNAFNGQVMQENLYGRFSDYYSRALGAYAKQQYSSGAAGYDDSSLLKQNLDALRQCIQSLRDGYKEALRMSGSEYAAQQQQKGLDYLERTSDKKMFAASGGFGAMKKEIEKGNAEVMKKTPNAMDNTIETEVLQNPEELIRPIQEVIKLGEQPGMTFPAFLRLQIERGLDKAMEGTVVARKGYLYSLEFTKALSANPYYIKSAERKIEVFDKLASASKFGVPGQFELNLAFDDVDREFDPQIRKWDRVKGIWEKMIWDLYEWSLSYCSFAPRIKPWVDAKDPMAATKQTQNTMPGIFKEYEYLLQKYFGMAFPDIFGHPTFEWEVKYHTFPFSQELTEFLIAEVYPPCKPFNHLPADIVQKRASFYKMDRNGDDREMNPELHLPAERLRVFYDHQFGEGRYESKYGAIEKSDAKADPWNWETFK
jgi:hypothetical protein